MSDDDVQYETKEVRALRGMEARSRAKAEAEGWDFVSERRLSAIQTTLIFRRPKAKIPRKAWIIGGAVAAVLIAIIVTGATLERMNQPTADVASSPQPTTAPETTTSPQPTATPEPAPVLSDVTEAEVLDAFLAYFTERATTGVMVGKAVVEVTFSGGVVTVTFDPAAAGVTPEDFDSLNPFDNLANFAATPVAFNDEIGNRLRPEIDSIVTVRSDGTPMGTFSRADILALNELEK